jgi:hypothetical protein
MAEWENPYPIRLKGSAENGLISFISPDLPLLLSTLDSRSGRTGALFAKV